MGKKVELKISPITVLDNDHELWETHIGNSEMDLLYSVWGKSEEESRKRAQWFTISLNGLSKNRFCRYGNVT